MLVLVAWVVLIGYIYGDAKRRQMRHVMWTLLAIFVPHAIGMIFYFILRDPPPKTCPGCGHVEKARFPFCPHCGTLMQPTCPECDKPVESTWANCASCGQRITRHFHEKAARVKPFFLIVPFVLATADQREAQLAFSLSFRERFLVRPSRQPIADQREAHNAAIPNSQITDSPYFHPHSLWSDCSGARCPQWKRVLPSRSRTECLCFQRRRSWRVPQSPELGDFALSPVKRQSYCVPVVGCDSAMARTLPLLPTADEAGSLVFSQLPQLLSSCHAFRHA